MLVAIFVPTFPPYEFNSIFFDVFQSIKSYLLSFLSNAKISIVPAISNSVLGVEVPIPIEPVFLIYKALCGNLYVNAQAEFTSAMAVGDELSFYWAINWDANGGGKGFDFKSNGTTVYTVQNSNNQNITAGGVTAESVYGTNPMLVTLKRSSQSTYEFTMTKRSSGAPYTTSITSSSAINQVNFFCGNQNEGSGQRNLYFNKLNMVKQSGATYAWSPSSGLSATTIPNPIASPSVTTNYVLTVTSADGCVSTDSVLVTVNDSITVDAGSDVTICEGSALSLTGAGSESIYAWSGPDGYSSSDLNAIVSTNATTAMGGNYVLSMTDTTGCVATDTVSVTVNPLPIVPSFNPTCA